MVCNRSAHRLLPVVLIWSTTIWLSHPARAETDEALQAKLTAAVTLLSAGEAQRAAVELSSLVGASQATEAPVHYHLGKALYRLGFLFGALDQMELVLQDPGAGDFASSALEWCLIIGRKMADDVPVNEALIRSAQGRLPNRYRGSLSSVWPGIISFEP